MNVNKVMLAGRLTRDVETRQTTGGTTVANFGLAVNRKFKHSTDGIREEVAFIDLEAFGRTAEVMAEHLHKGRTVWIEGRLKLDQWQDRDGNNRSKMKVVVDQFEFVPDGQDRSAAPVGAGQRDVPNDDDIPF